MPHFVPLVLRSRARVSRPKTTANKQLPQFVRTDSFRASVIHVVATAAVGVSPWNTVVARTETITAKSIKARALLNKKHPD